ncbi:DUF5989 family protein [Bremerella alba]|uniref:Uncharacterized protein n=1 Tax=Bremerella alba TaxID=980252 RepID=A0A7V8V2R8_9BACT|nr:DUF5989 family protein [Bremerella alba]MBA2113884.1 hypothetical protein [Bremerella alba]
MTDDPQSTDHDSNKDFASQAEGNDPGIVREFVLYLQENKKWWLIPMILTLLAIGVVGLLAGSGLAPFVYTLF